MMREIKFRAWDTERKEMVYNMHNVTITFDVNKIIIGRQHDGGGWYELKLMQFTGRKDKKGNDILGSRNTNAEPPADN